MCDDVKDSRRIDVAKGGLVAIIKPSLFASGKRPFPPKIVVDAQEVRVPSLAFEAGHKIFLKPLPDLADQTLKILPIVSYANLWFTVLCFQPLLNFLEGHVMHLDELLEKATDLEQIAQLVRGKHATQVTIKEQHSGFVDRHEVANQTIRKDLVLSDQVQVQFGENGTYFAGVCQEPDDFLKVESKVRHGIAVLPAASLDDSFPISFDKVLRHGEMMKGDKGFLSLYPGESQGLDIFFHQRLVELAFFGAETPKVQREADHVLR